MAIPGASFPVGIALRVTKAYKPQEGEKGGMDHEGELTSVNPNVNLKSNLATTCTTRGVYTWNKWIKELSTYERNNFYDKLVLILGLFPVDLGNLREKHFVAQYLFWSTLASHLRAKCFRPKRFGTLLVRSASSESNFPSFFLAML